MSEKLKFDDSPPPSPQDANQLGTLASTPSYSSVTLYKMGGTNN